MQAFNDTWSARTTGVSGIEGKLANVSTFERMSVINSLLPTGKMQATWEVINLLQIEGSGLDQIQRPIVYTPAYLEFDDFRSPASKFALRNEWAFDSVIRLWSLGYQAGIIAKFFDSIPPQISSVAKRVLGLMENLARVRAASRAAGSRDNPAPICPPTSFGAEDDQNLRFQMRADAARWEGENVYGFFQIAFNPATRQRTGVVMNSRYADLLGMHKEELLSR
eukprot:CAMPEP_0172191730 /NCGR_PEP_ID=MMETSP1050-20130122/23891_1 /TAXON_ID=233186 /ORGANISM="Cryptomonas curvata, Strain CCAP979/52" /LENGTH=222 /DNA_ID=CAMNT_0012866867 /DNA_START=48 /DNA_END=714 /DNA_ORIENTATION=+